MNLTMNQIRHLMDEQSSDDLTKVELKEEKTLEEYGIDSLGVVSLAFDIDDMTGIQIDDSELENMKTLGDVKGLLNKEGVTITG